MFRFLLAGWISFAAAAMAQTAPLPSNGMGFSLEYMDRSVAPGDDFYRYADGAWVKNNPVPADKARWTTFIELSERNWLLARGILEEAATNKRPQSKPAQEVGVLYASGMNTNRIDKLGVRPIKPLLKMIDRATNMPQLFRVMGQLNERGIGKFFDSGVGPDEKNSSIYAYEFSQGGLTLPDRDYYLKDEFAPQREAYRAHLTQMFGFLNEKPKVAARHAETVLDLETRIAKISRTRLELRDPIKNYTKMSSAQWLERNPGIPWENYVEGCGLLARPKPVTNSLALISYVVVGQPEHFDALEKLLAERPLDDWKVLLRWKVLFSSAPYLSHQIDEEFFAFFGKVMSGAQQQEPRWKRTAKTVNGTIGEALGQLYVERYYPASAKARMNEMVANIKSVFSQRLARVAWMSEATRAKAQEKFARFTQKIGCPDTFRDYSSVELRRDDYLGNVQRVNAFETHRQLARIGQPVDRTEWHMTPITVNAYINPTQNEIVFPAGILQPPFFDPQADDAVNYGGICTVIGHEITHGYDDQGRKFDADGNMKDWWTPEDAQTFEAAAQKVIDEYNSFEALPGLHVNGTLTLGENLADLGGVSVAYEALQQSLAKDPAKRVKIDGLTPEQRFFLSFAQIWRTNVRPAEQQRLILTDPHSPGRFRAVGPLLHLQAFYDAFGIPTNAPIYLPVEKRAVIW